MDGRQFEEDLATQKAIRDKLFQYNKTLGKKINDLTLEIAQMKKQDPAIGGIESEGYRRWQERLATNAKLEKNIALERERLRILSERNTDITEMDLDLLSQTELIRLVKQLERVRTDLQSDLREIEVSLDAQATEYARLNEMKNLYHAEQDLRERKRRQTISNPSTTART